MSSNSKYPILEKRRIDQWKAAELKAELKRRKLSSRGLKEDLIRRLDEALRNERDNADEQTNGLDGDPPVSDGGDNNQEHASIGSAPTKEINEDTNMFGKVDDVQVQAEKTNHSTAAVDEGILHDGVSVKESPKVEEVINVTTLETIITVTETVVSEAALTVEELHNIENKDSKIDSKALESKPQLDSENIKPQLESEDTKPQLDGVNMEPFVKEDVEEKHDVKDMIVGLHKKHDGADVGLSEKLNLDRSSGDDSIEDAMENKADSGNTPEVEGPVFKEEKFADIAVQGSTANTKNSDIENDVSSFPFENRKLNDQTGLGNESGKGQCRWNAENLKVPELQNASHASTKDILQSTPSEDLPEMDMSGDFVEIILGFIATPRELCRMARVSKKFREIVDLDTLWSKFVLGLENVPNLPIFPSKKKLYFHICDNPLRLRVGNSILAIEKDTGHRSYLIGVEDLHMGPPQVWSLIDNHHPSHFEKVQHGDFADFVDFDGFGGCVIKSNTIEGGILSTGVDYIVYIVFLSIEHDLPNEGPFESLFLLTQQRKDGIVNIGQNQRIPRLPIIREDGWLKMQIALFRNQEPCDSEISFLIHLTANSYNIIVEGIEFRAIPMLNERLE